MIQFEFVGEIRHVKVREFGAFGAMNVIRCLRLRRLHRIEGCAEESILIHEIEIFHAVKFVYHTTIGSQVSDVVMWDREEN